VVSVILGFVSRRQGVRVGVVDQRVVAIAPRKLLERDRNGEGDEVEIRLGAFPGSFSCETRRARASTRTNIKT